MKLVANGFGDMVSVNLVIAMARATSVIMSTTGLGTWLVEASVTALSQSGVSAGVFGLLDYILHVGLSFLVPSSSGLAGLSAPIVSPIVSQLGWSVETSIMINVAANGFVNLFTPTCGFIMGGLALRARPPRELAEVGLETAPSRCSSSSASSYDRDGGAEAEFPLELSHDLMVKYRLYAPWRTTGILQTRAASPALV